MAIAPDYGPSLTGSFAWFDRDTSAWKTWQLCLDGDWVEFLATFPRAGMTRSGIAFRLAPLVPHIDEIGSLLWPTPRAADCQRGPDYGGTPGHQGGGESIGGGSSLADGVGKRLEGPIHGCDGSAAYGRIFQRGPASGGITSADAADAYQLVASEGRTERGGEFLRIGSDQESNLGGEPGTTNWTIEPAVGRMAYGVPNYVDRVRCLGNAVVPQVAEYIARRIIEASKR